MIYRVLIIITVVVLNALFMFEANAEKVCVRYRVTKNGRKVKTKSMIAETCPRRFDELIDLSTIVGAQGEKGTKGDQGSKGERGPKGDTGPKGDAGAKGPGVALYDSLGVEIGPIMQSGCIGRSNPSRFHYATVLLTLGDLKMPACVSSSGFLTHSSLYFLTNDCSGQPYLFPHTVAEEGTLFDSGIVVATEGGKAMYRPDYGGGIHTVTRRSSYSPSQGCEAYTQEDDLYQAIEVTNLDSDFTPPFSVGD